MKKEISTTNLFSLEEQSGVAFKNQTRKREIINLLDQKGKSTIPEIAQHLNISVPTITLLISELWEDLIIEDYGKIDAMAGRPANLYGLNSNACFFIGMDVRDDYINIGLLDFNKNITVTELYIPYQLENTEVSLNKLIDILKTFLKSPKIAKRKVLAICINLTGRINTNNGYSYSFFHFSEEPLARIIESKVGIKVFLENDSRAMAYGEFHKGIVKNEKNVLFVNVDLGIGLGIMINGDVYYGKSGFSGELGHIAMFDNEIICHCGKKGCLETEASGRALLRLFKERIQEGSVSSIMKGVQNIKDLTLKDILSGAQQEDVLTIELITEIGYKLGRGISVLMNIFNPELIVLGGTLMAVSGEYLLLPIKMAVNKYSLSLVNNDSSLCISQLGEKAGVIGSGLIARNRIMST